MEPLVSICCITYNHEVFIRDAIEGFLMQKTSFPIEIIIHDDASTDNTAQIIKEYEDKYPDLFCNIFQNENQWSKGGGSIYARFVFPKTRGKYIAICEGDDYWTDPLKLQKQVDFLEAASDFSMCFHNALKVYDIYDRTDLFNIINESTEIFLEDILKNWIIPTASIVFRKSVLPLPSWYNEIYSAEQTLALTAISKGRLFYFNSIMSVYRVNLINKDSATYKIKGKILFYLNEHIKLYTYYMNDSICIDKLQIESKLKKLQKELKFYQLKIQHPFLALLVMPFFSLGKLFKKFINK